MVLQKCLPEAITKGKKTMNIITTDNHREQVECGQKIVKEHPDIYTERVIQGIDKIIKNYHLPAGISENDAFYISIYYYWRYGFVTKEVFAYDLLTKSQDLAASYISHMDRLNYTRHLNKSEDEHFLSNKYETYCLLRDFYGREIIYVPDLSGMDDFCQFVSAHHEFVIKPVGLASSIGVRKCDLQSFHNDPWKALTAILQESESIRSHYKWSSGKGVLVEEIIKQDDSLARLHPASVNNIRITTVKLGKDVHILYPVLRIGKGRRFICSCSTGSINTGINVKSGVTETDGFDMETHHYIRHPDLEYSIQGIQIPKWDELVELVVMLALRFENLNYIGWDVTLSDQGKWVVIEANENGAFDIMQLAYRKGIRDEFSDLIHWKPNQKYWWTGRYT